ncbi:monosaccharide ABC transporter substrate-binding protein, CUT2 family [Halanaerobium salsuginis]|uniref:Monosaccharide ABC transporter substrate-binding protein, CUT2 family n=1 Tax=Halanaerobium salsuginis TaxID=29563 RepID=A0A1I4L1U7_9FIRM|nr:monosaccharide ABC transporter substrate-binding protein, CUT2 family [Halanaerobium salsuginis]
MIKLSEKYKFSLIINFIMIFILLSFNFNSVLAADSNLAIDNKKLTIAFVPRSLDNPIFLDAFEKSQQQAVQLGIKLEWVSSFTYDAEKQISIIKSLIKQQVDGMIVSVNNTPDYIEVINQAVAAGIPVATFDADAPDSKRLFHIGIDNYKAGQATARGLLKVLRQEGIDYQGQAKKLQMMIMTGVRGALNLDSRIAGFSDTIADSNIVLSDIVENQDNVNLSVELLEQYLQKNPQIDIIFFAGGWPFYVPAEALPNFQKWAAEGGIAVGIDIFYDALLLEQRGLLKYLVGQDMSAMGSRGLLALYNYLIEGEKPPEYIETGLEIADKNNLKQLLQTHQPWRVK